MTRWTVIRPRDLWRLCQAWRWLVCSTVAVLYLVLGHHRLVRSLSARTWRAIDDYGLAVAPLVVFALFGLLVDSRSADSRP
jgi:hypothetical protein